MVLKNVFHPDDARAAYNYYDELYEEVCRGAWARVTMDRFRHSSHSTVKKRRPPTDIFSNQILKQVEAAMEKLGEVEKITIFKNNPAGVVRRPSRCRPPSTHTHTRPSTHNHLPAAQAHAAPQARPHPGTNGRRFLHVPPPPSRPRAAGIGALQAVLVGRARD